MKLDRKNLMLYAVTDRHWLKERSLYHAVEDALRGGVTMVQLREKDDMELGHGAYLREALEIRDLCQRYRVPLLIDDDVDLALECGADGVHVGQSDMEAGKVRDLIGPDRILGVSAGTVEEALTAEKRGADYLGVGSIFPTGSKHDAEAVSIRTLKEICSAVSIPVVAIGGITRENVTELSGSGIAGISVISAIFSKDDIEYAARDLKERLCSVLDLWEESIPEGL